MSKLAEFAPSAAFYILALAAQVSGYTNSTAAIFLAGIATILLLIPVLNRARLRRNKGAMLLDPTTITAVGIFGLFVFAAVVLWGFIWQSRVVDSRPMIVVSPGQQGPPQVFGGPLRLVPNISPLPPTENAERITRYIQLKKAAEEIEATKSAFQNVSESLKTRMKPTYRGMVMGRAEQQSKWRVAQDNIKKINDGLYQNRPIDLTSVPELSNPLIKAPDEDVYGDDADGKYRFRTFHFLNVNIVKQIDALSLDIKNELESVTREIEKLPEAKLIKPN